MNNMQRLEQVVACLPEAERADRRPSLRPTQPAPSQELTTACKSFSLDNDPEPSQPYVTFLVGG